MASFANYRITQLPPVNNNHHSHHHPHLNINQTIPHHQASLIIPEIHYSSEDLINSVYTSSGGQLGSFSNTGASSNQRHNLIHSTQSGLDNNSNNSAAASPSSSSSTPTVTALIYPHTANSFTHIPKIYM